MMPNGRLKIQLAFNNVRYMTAHGVGADLAVTKQTLPERTNLGQAHSWQINIGELAPTEQGKDGSLQVFWLEFSQMEVNRMNWRQQTVKVEGELSYRNGFRDINEPVCFAFLASSPPGSAAIQNDLNGFFETCDKSEPRHSRRRPRPESKFQAVMSCSIQIRTLSDTVPPWKVNSFGV
jgi:hypothetical protein